MSKILSEAVDYMQELEAKNEKLEAENKEFTEYVSGLEDDVYGPNRAKELGVENERLKTQFDCLASLVIGRNPETWEAYLEDIKKDKK